MFEIVEAGGFVYCFITQEHKPSLFLKYKKTWGNNFTSETSIQISIALFDYINPIMCLYWIMSGKEILDLEELVGDWCKENKK
ncbi:MAG: hypothetical protein H7842_14935 [Gammaproteobacteria bacterium SHHR-1]